MIRFPNPLLLSFFFAACTPTRYEAQNLGAKPFNQLDLGDNVCGLAALLNSWRFGNPQWRKLSETPPGLSDRERIRTIARGPAMRKSSSLHGQARWSKNGINIVDLRDVANEVGRPHLLPTLSEETLFLKPTESQQAHLRRVKLLAVRSLSNGFPPILSIRRFVKRNGEWISIQGHFVTIISVPGSITANNKSFDVRYIDPFGGKFLDGRISVYYSAFLGQNASRNPNLQALFPSPNDRKYFVRPGEESFLAVSAILGRF